MLFIDYIQTIQDISTDSKYLRWYLAIISNAQSRPKSKRQATKLIGPCERHHVVPDCLFIKRTRSGIKGFIEGDPNHSDNLVFLTLREHFLVHMLLPKMMKSQEYAHRLSPAIFKMMDKSEVINSRTFETAKLIASNFSSNSLESVKQRKKQVLRARYGVEHNSQIPEVKEQKKLTLQQNYGVIGPLAHPDIAQRRRDTLAELYGDENFNNMEKNIATVNERYGVDNVFQSEAVKDKSKNTMLERYGVEHNSKIQVTCPHCGKIGGQLSMKLSHFDRCKHNPNQIRFQCPHCDVSSGNRAVMNRYHFDKCKSNPNRLAV